MKLSQLENNIKNKKSFLCLGLDSDIDKIPKHLLGNSDPVFEFNKILIDELNQKIVAVKLNTAFYESRGAAGWTSMEKTINYLNKFYPELFTIADAKRGDIGNTSKMYAKAFFENLNFDSITLSPYMGMDTVLEFMDYDEKYPIILALTSNKGAEDFQIPNNLYESVITKSMSLKRAKKIMFVVGATKSDFLKNLRNILPDNFLLLPGVGAQGANISEVINSCTNSENKKILINVSRSIIYAGNDENFVSEAVKKVDELNNSFNFK
ncbi:MAG: orotidine 5'-phosphate decarboxylase [Flavobacteriaceae bacterium]|nr:MAG: orotidine 5'-phosphate decarboxylase [Flavobacteriaceae bacterium]